MKIKTSGMKLQEGLRKVIGVSNAKITPSVLRNVLIEAKDGKVDLTATNLDITLKSSVACEVLEEGATTVPGKMFQNIVSALPVGDVEIETDAVDKMKVRGGETNFRVSGISASKFPELAKVKDDFVFKMSEKDLKNAMRRTAYAQSVDVTRRSLNGVLFDFAGEHLKTVASDGRRLAVSLVKADWKCADTRFILPSGAVREMQRLLEGDGSVTIRFAGKLVVFEFEKAETTMYAKVVEEEFPNYAQVVPKDLKYKAVCDRQQFIDVLNRVSIMVIDATPSVKLTFENGTLDAKVIGMDEGEAHDKMPIKYDGEKVEIVFNPHYMLEPMKASDSDGVVIDIGGEYQPIIIKGECDEGLNVLMPLRKN